MPTNFNLLEGSLQMGSCSASTDHSIKFQHARVVREPMGCTCISIKSCTECSDGRIFRLASAEWAQLE